MNQLAVYTNQFNAQKAELITLYSSPSMALTFRSYRCNSLDKLITPQNTLSYVSKGFKRMFIDGHAFLLNAGDLLYIPKNAVVFSYLETGADRFESINLTFEAAPVDPADLSFISAPHCIRDTAIQNKFRRLIRAENPAGLLPELLRAIHPNMSLLNNSRTPVKTDPLITAVAQHIYRNQKLPVIASDCNMSLSTFKRHFETRFGMAPKDWMIRRKLETAYFEMQVLQYAVSDACYRAGFENLPHFSYSFKKHFGFAPSTLLGQRSKLN